jgi:AcrR family transcriptional regulator
LSSELSAKEALLKAALEIISKKGAQGISIREISGRAGVNSAAISYYFGSKDKLIEEASYFYYQRVEEIFGLLTSADCKPLERLKFFSFELIKHINEYPGFLKNEIEQHASNGSVDKEVENRIKFQLQAVMKVLAEATGSEDSEVLMMKAIQFLSSLIYPQLLGSGSLSSVFEGKSPSEVMETYVDELIKNTAGTKGQVRCPGI